MAIPFGQTYIIRILYVYSYSLFVFFCLSIQGKKTLSIPYYQLCVYFFISFFKFNNKAISWLTFLQDLLRLNDMEKFD